MNYRESWNEGMKCGTIGCCLLLAVVAGKAQEQTHIAPQAERVLRAACEYLKEARSFSFTGEVWREHVTETGQKLQFSRSITFQVKRPNRIHIEIHSPHSDRGFWFNGEALAILDRKQKLFSTGSVSGDLDTALDTARDRYGIDLPLIDLVVSNPYVSVTAKVLKGSYYGLAPVMGLNCHHLAFTQQNIDWQLWVEEGPQPLIRRLVITHKQEAGAPEFSATISRWDFKTPLSDADFVFKPPLGAHKIQLNDAGKEEHSGKASTSGKSQ